MRLRVRVVLRAARLDRAASRVAWLVLLAVWAGRLVRVVLPVMRPGRAMLWAVRLVLLAVWVRLRARVMLRAAPMVRAALWRCIRSVSVRGLVAHRWVDPVRQWGIRVLP
ncbi:hypothetical protein OG874_19410 [Nocardia sp. NBC_00565]|uniref:hypothetical protein n=1 Tax=Nocardia sp. NBC_00565 TaxID=2975993 RepID=UPI002E81977D|nr:hypothetical protein [Nocardia sp. NBC_00565]WUC08363.1 hypothetical protein OG874_19410 [Nocardia sp. NBC_00565]